MVNSHLHVSQRKSQDRPVKSDTRREGLALTTDFSAATEMPALRIKQTAATNRAVCEGVKTFVEFFGEKMGKIYKLK